MKSLNDVRLRMLFESADQLISVSIFCNLNAANYFGGKNGPFLNFKSNPIERDPPTMAKIPSCGHACNSLQEGHANETLKFAALRVAPVVWKESGEGGCTCNRRRDDCLVSGGHSLRHTHPVMRCSVQ